MNRLALALAVALAAPAVIAQRVITPSGTQIVPTPIDAFSSIKPIGFAFPFNGTTYTDCYISDHGLVSFSNAGAPAAPPGGSFTYSVLANSLVANAPIVAAYWSDHNAPGGIFIDNSSPTVCTITWLNAQTYFNQQPAFTTQLKLFSSGRIEILMDHHVVNQGSSFDLNAIVGAGAGTPGVLPAPSDLSAGVTTASTSVFEQFTTSAASTPNPNFDLTARRVAMTPSGTGWNVAVSWLPAVGAEGTQITPTPIDNWSAIQSIGFAFPFNGTTYTNCYISDHGLVSFSNAGTPGAPPAGSFTYTVGASSLVANAPMIAAYWSDHRAPGGIFLNSTATTCTITWRDAQTFSNQNPPFTAQLRLQSTGRVELLLDGRVDNRGSAFDLDAVIGMGAGTPGVLPAASNLSAGVTTTNSTVFEQFTTSAASTPNPLFDVAARQLEFVPATGGGWNVSNEPLPTIQAAGTEILPTPVDGWTALQPIGFAFPFNGTSYTDIYISDHGEIGLSNGGTPGTPAGSTFAIAGSALGTGGPRICAYWSDANCNKANASAAGIFIDNTSTTHCTVTWRDSETYFNARPPFSMQLTLHADGHITVNLENRVTNQGSTFDLDAVVGIGNGTATPLPAASDLSAGVTTADPSVYEQFTAVTAGTPNPNFDLSGATLNFYPQNPGWLVTKETIGCAKKQQYGTGCNGLSVDSNLPIIGASWNLQTTGIDPLSPISITFFGPEFVAGLPLPAIGIPAPGCSVHLNAIIANLSAPSVGGTSVTPITIPVSNALKGSQLSAQSLCLTLANPAAISTSNGVTGTIGY